MLELAEAGSSDFLIGRHLIGINQSKEASAADLEFSRDRMLVWRCRDVDAAIDHRGCWGEDC